MRVPPYRQQAVRDLAWLVQAPPLLAEGPALPARDDADAWFAALDAEPADLDAWLEGWRLSAWQPRLGRYVERLLEFWLARHPTARLLGSRVPVSQAGRSLGDLDLVAGLADGSVACWEVAFKCYCIAGDPAEPGAWWTPDGREALAEKLDHLRGQQLPLATSPAARAALGLDATTTLRAGALIVGWLFGRDGAPTLRPAGIGDCPGGWWQETGSEPPRTRQPARYVLLERAELIAPLRLADDRRRLLASGELRSSLQRRPPEAPPANVAVVVPDLAGGWVERERGVVVPPGWPQAADARRGSSGRHQTRR